MAVEFTLEFNVQSSTRGNYRELIRNLLVRLGVRFSHNRRVLAVQQNPPTRFFDLVLQTNDHAVRFRFRMDNLYLLGYRMENGQWLEFNNDENEHLITEQGTNFLGFGGSYDGLARAAHRTIEETRVGVHNLEFAINQLALTTSGEARARSLVVVIMMICESTRLNPVYNYMADSFDNRPNATRDIEGRIQSWIMTLVRSWYALSAALLRADAYPEERFQLRENNIRIPPYGGEIRTLAQAAEAVNILLGLCFTYRGSSRRFPRMVSNKGDCFLGLRLMEVFSVRINDIDHEDPGELYGAITIDNGLYTQYIYNRTRDNYESIRPGQNVTLTGPSESIFALGNFTIKLLLTDKDIVSWDDVIINQDISWDVGNMGNVYDKLISRRLDSSRGSVTVNCAVLRNAVSAKVTVTLKEGGEATTEVYGHISACYGNWVDTNTTSLLFDRTDRKNYVEVNHWENIPLLRSVFAVPLNDSLKVTARLKDYDPISPDDLIADGTVEFPVPNTIPATTSKGIYGEDGNWIQVTVNWSSGL